jgi:hypothetical protein
VEETEMGATLKVYPKLGVAAVGSTSFIVSPDRCFYQNQTDWGGTLADMKVNSGVEYWASLMGGW